MKNKIPGLKLLRKRGEAVILTMPGGVRVEVRVSESHQGWARIAIVAPPEVRVMREELLDEEEVEPCAS